MPDEKVYDQRESALEAGHMPKMEGNQACRSGFDPVSKEIEQALARAHANIAALVEDETAPLKTRIGELERDLRAAKYLTEQSKKREADQLLLIAYHHAKAGAELAARLSKIIALLPPDEQNPAHLLVRQMIDVFSIADTLVADAGNKTPHEKGPSGG